MSRITDFLNEAGVFFLATVDGDRPRLRPLGAHMEMDGKVIFGVGDFKDVYRQLCKNPNTEIVACKKDGHWMRYSGKAVFETDPKYAKKMLLNLGYESFFRGTKTIRANREKYDCNIPWAVLLDPTSACNLHCTGCWAAEYGDKLNLS